VHLQDSNLNGQKVAIFRRTLQNSDKIPTISCKFSTDEIGLIIA